MSSLLCCCVSHWATQDTKNLEETLASTPKFPLCSLSAVIRGLDWCGLFCLEQDSGVIQGRMQQTAESERASSLMAMEMSE